MTHYEVHRLNQDRWLLDGVFDDKSTAIEDAKNLMSRARALMAVRVLKVEEQQEGFVEWIVYDRDSTAPRPTSQRFLPLLRAPARVRRAAAIRRRARRIARGEAREPGSAMALTMLLVLAGLLVFLAQMLEPKDVWLFDRPEARAPHTLANPWTGETSK